MLDQHIQHIVAPSNHFNSHFGEKRVLNLVYKLNSAEHLNSLFFMEVWPLKQNVYSQDTANKILRQYCKVIKLIEGEHFNYFLKLVPVHVLRVQAALH